MTFIKYLGCIVISLVAGFACAWLVLGKEDPNCALVGVPAVSFEQRASELHDSHVGALATALGYSYGLYKQEAAQRRDLEVRSIGQQAEIVNLQREVAELRGQKVTGIAPTLKHYWEVKLAPYEKTATRIIQGVAKVAR